MQRLWHETITHGIVGGLVAGAVVALWFLVVDTTAGAPFRTPVILSGVLFGRESVAAYTILHFGVFVLLGVAASGMLAALRTPPALLIGVVFALGVLAVVFYGALLFTGARVFEVLPWQHVLAANVTAGLAMMAYLHRAGRETTPLGWQVLRGHPLLLKGFATGLVGAAAVAVWFLLLDVAAGRPFRTPAALGAALLFGAQGPADIATTFALVAAYTVVHVAAFCAVGVVLVAAAEQIERTPALVLLAGLAFIVVEALSVAVLAAGAAWVLGALGVWTVAAANVLAVGAMGWTVWRTHPVLRRRLLHEPLNVRV